MKRIDKIKWLIANDEIEPIEMDIPEEGEGLVLHLNVSDMFMWGCSDWVMIEPEHIDGLYADCVNDPQWGSLRWEAVRRNVQPQKPVIEMIKSTDKWDKVFQSLRTNPDSIIPAPTGDKSDEG